MFNHSVSKALSNVIEHIDGAYCFVKEGRANKVIESSFTYLEKHLSQLRTG